MSQVTDMEKLRGAVPEQQAAFHARGKRADAVLLKAEREPSIKVRRDKFALRDEDRALLEELVGRAGEVRCRTSMSAVVRAGIALLDRLSPEELARHIESVPKVNRGRK